MSGPYQLTPPNPTPSLPPSTSQQSQRIAGLAPILAKMEASTIKDNLKIVVAPVVTATKGARASPKVELLRTHSPPLLGDNNKDSALNSCQNLPCTEECRLLAAVTSNPNSSSIVFDLSNSFTCSFALVAHDDIETMIGQWGVQFKCNHKDSQSSKESLNSFIINHRYRDISRFEHFLSKVMGVLLAQGSCLSREIIILNENI
jgi:hypothetical protein